MLTGMDVISVERLEATLKGKKLFFLNYWVGHVPPIYVKGEQLEIERSGK